MNEPGILFLDDEQNVLNALRRLFQDEGAPLVLTTSPEEALERIAKGGIAVAVSDYRMPAMTGIQFLEQVRQSSSQTARILLTGHADVKIAMEAINKGAVYRFLTKPWDDGELVHAVRQAAAYHALVTENRKLTELTLAQNRRLKDLNENLEEKVRERTREIEGLNKELEKTLMGAVRVMAGLTEVHSKVIGSHSRRVAAISKGIAAKLGLGREEALQVEVAALLHDAGKMAIPVEVLNKQESGLTFKNKDALRRHPTMGEALVRMVPNMEVAARLVRHHHERFGGGGFPDGLKGEAIPIGSRIIAVADAYDNALNTRSGYQAATPAKVFQDLKDAGTRELDPRVLDALGIHLQEVRALAGDPGEVELEAKDLQAGMVLSREVRNARGLLLVPARTKLTPALLQTLLDYPVSERQIEGIYIYRMPPTAGEGR